jgi:hypothetical protein
LPWLAGQKQQSDTPEKHERKKRRNGDAARLSAFLGVMSLA